MAESRIKDENYYQIQGWMINRLGLKGVSLSVFAIIYGFTQDGDTEFKGSLQYICDFCGGVSKPTVIKALKELVDKKYLIRREEVINNVQFNRYKANLPLLKIFNGGSKEILTGGVKEFNEGSKNPLPNNNTYNKDLDNKDHKENTPQAERPKADTTDYELFKDTYNKFCSSLPQIRALSDKRKKAIRDFLKQLEFKDFEEACKKANENNFLAGQNDRGWKADFDFIIRPDKALSIIEGGKYGGNTAPQGSFDTDSFYNAAVKRSLGGRDPFIEFMENQSGKDVF